MNSSLFRLTKERLGGKVSADNFIPDEEEEIEEPEPEDNSLLEAIADLSESIKHIQVQAPAVDMTPVVESIRTLHDRITKKRKWKFDIVRDEDGEISAINATEI